MEAALRKAWPHGEVFIEDEYRSGRVNALASLVDQYIKESSEKKLLVSREFLPGRTLRVIRKFSHTRVSGLDRAIDISRNILNLQEDWDGEGSSGYSEATWSRATTFLKSTSEMIEKKFGVDITAPQIYPVPDGSIDLHWKDDTHELLVNFPPDENTPASFYGDDYGQVHIKGTFPQASRQLTLLCWLAEHCE